MRFKILAGGFVIGTLWGCSSPVTHERLVNLQRAIMDEHRATVARPGLEDAVLKLQAAELEDVASMVSATQ